MFGRAKILVLMITLVAVPTAAALAWAYWSKDPSARPLGITKEAIDTFEGTGEVEIITQITWNPDRHTKPTALAKALQSSFGAKGVETRIQFVKQDVSKVQIVFDIGASHIGPVPANRAASQIGPAVEAYRQHVPFKP